MKNFEITCPCCQATIIVDRLNGEVLLHKAKETRGPGGCQRPLTISTSR